jgi:hypothetical protein
MKAEKFKNLILAGALVLTGTLAVGNFVDASGPKNALCGGAPDPLPRIHSLKGNTEFYFVSGSDNRVWHVVNKYYPLNSIDGPSFNTAAYTFSSDSVEVENKYAGMPEFSRQAESLPGLSVNNFTNINN